MSEAMSEAIRVGKFVYVLELSGGKFYVGKTNSPEFRLQSHFDANGSAWTKKHKPIRVVEVVSVDEYRDEYKEDMYTLQYMQKYGIDNVRGGSFCEIQLSQDTKNVITKMLRSANDKCFNCGLSGHFAKTCTVSSVSSSEEEVEEEKCTRCNRTGHVAKNCYAKTVQKKYSSDEDSSEEEKCTRCNRTGHVAKNCYAKTIQKNYSSDEDSSEESYKRTGNSAKKYYAKTKSNYKPYSKYTNYKH